MRTPDQSFTEERLGREFDVGTVCSVDEPRVARAPLLSPLWFVAP